MDLDERNKRVLQTIIDCYVSTGMPVGSTTLCRKYDFGLSSATLRNIMAELEELGLLSHPHTSAGRIPTEAGYRYYIDSLISVQNDAQDFLSQLEHAPPIHGGEVNDLMEEASRFLAALSRCAGVVVSPMEIETRYKHIEFIRLGGRQVLIIFVTDTGTVQNKLIELDDGILQNDLNRFSAYLGEELERWSLSQIRQRIIEKMREEKIVFSKLMDETYRASEDLHSREVEKVFIGGASQIMEIPEFSDIEKMKSLLRAFEDKYKLLKILDKTATAEGVKVFIGSENPYFDMEGCSLVVSKYRAGDNIIGTLGVIGPTRMNYKQVIHIVDYTAKLVGSLLSERFQKGLLR